MTIYTDNKETLQNALKRIEELEAQIEKMKCCTNCKHSRAEYKHCITDKHAEEYVMREDIITENDRVPFDNGYGFQTVSFEDEVKKVYKDGFLAGLKAGRPQWHDLRKDPNDLPKGYAENTRFLCSVKGESLFLVRYGSFWQGNLEVIAWCEIPTFDKE